MEAAREAARGAEAVREAPMEAMGAGESVEETAATAATAAAREGVVEVPAKVAGDWCSRNRIEAQQTQAARARSA